MDDTFHTHPHGVACGICAGPKSVPVSWARHGLGLHHETLALPGVSFLAHPMVAGGGGNRMGTDPSVWGEGGKT